MARYIIGVDEVGRGPLAGPVTVAAVCAKSFRKFRGIRDSKKFSEKQRGEWLKKINGTQGLKISVSSVGPALIDRLGISAAARLAVGRCLKKLAIGRKPHAIVLDGSLYAPRTYLNQETIIRGDEKIPLIAAASIVAKTHRDKKMSRLSKEYPLYNFHVHKGYGTKLHRKLVKKHGLCDIHRRSFCGKLV